MKILGLSIKYKNADGEITEENLKTPHGYYVLLLFGIIVISFVAYVFQSAGIDSGTAKGIGSAFKFIFSILGRK